MTKSLEGKTALVTSGSRGIGRAVAERLARDGATVALTYKASKDAAEDAVRAIEDAGGHAFALHADLSNAGSIPALFDALNGELSDRGSRQLDILVNNAGNSGWGGLADATPESWDAMIAVHARAPFFVTQAAIRSGSNQQLTVVPIGNEDGRVVVANASRQCPTDTPETVAELIGRALPPPFAPRQRPL